MSALPNPPIACSRMYNVSPKVRSLWDGLFKWLSESSGTDLKVVAHEAPAPLSQLWSDPNMAAVLMCGYPFSKMALSERPIPLAAPVSSETWAQAQPLYASHLVSLRSRSAKSGSFRGSRMGWTVKDSQSGYHAPRSYLSTLDPNDWPEFTVGPLLNPNGVIEALFADKIDFGPIDAYSYQLLGMHEPSIIQGLHIVATTQAAPAPMLVASRGQPSNLVETFRHTLTTAHQSVAGREILKSLGLACFAEPKTTGYATLPVRAAVSDAVLGSTW